MIFIVVKFTIRPEHSDEWLSRVRDFTEATRAEPGNLFFEWSRSVETPHQFVLVEGFASAEAGERHVGSGHFKEAMAWMPDVVATTPEIINVHTDAEGWSPMAEVTPR
ncbi:putative quinol monooxygenase [Amycolatopsis suaedae]|uniref:Antibiotic biosynthesis monooxygenase n=1 Tax=Amycolatopsis suaedae TaxID=2510978 RepID=A0A4Q7JFE8_9PSEU|nr:putative quinol monooxygenase [Amycolatopsis suaedae]RZQ65946.1 antibiotic biosynthesis monooxygenase [Amycolatopsis suaedae]